MSNKITHTGMIESIDDGCLHVRILQASACAGCRVSSHCNASDSREKRIDVEDLHARDHRIGELVTVSTDTRVAGKAEWIAYGLPLILVVVTLIVVLQCFHSEGLAALAALVVLIPYYIGVYLLRNKIARKVRFRLEN